MKTTQADVLFHMYYSMPKWARSTVNEYEKNGSKWNRDYVGVPFNVSIDRCINNRSNEKPRNKKDNVNSLDNTINLLSLARSNMKHRSMSKIVGMSSATTLLEYLPELVESKGACKSADRSIWAARFLRKLKIANTR